MRSCPGKIEKEKNALQRRVTACNVESCGFLGWVLGTRNLLGWETLESNGGDSHHARPQGSQTGVWWLLFCLRRVAERITWPFKAILSWSGSFSLILESPQMAAFHQVITHHLDWCDTPWIAYISIEPRAFGLNPSLEMQKEDEGKVWTSPLNPSLASEPPFPVAMSSVIWQGAIYHADTLPCSSLPHPVSFTYFRSDWDVSYRGAFNLGVTCLMLIRVPKCHKQRHQPGRWTCQRRFSASLSDTTQSHSFQRKSGFHLINEPLIPLGDFKTTTTQH